MLPDRVGVDGLVVVEGFACDGADGVGGGHGCFCFPLLVLGLDDDARIFSHIVNDKIGGYFMAVDSRGLGELAGEADYLELLGVVVE